MDKEVYQIIKATWTFLKLYIQNRSNNKSVEYWDSEGEALHAIIDSTEGQPEYISKFAYDIALAADRLLIEIRREERKKEYI